MFTLLLLLACARAPLERQHVACATTADCDDDDLECVATIFGFTTCEVTCTDDEVCPDDQGCQHHGYFGDGVGACYVTSPWTSATIGQ